MKKNVIRLTESDLTRIVERVINEQSEERQFMRGIQQFLNQKIRANLAVDGKTGRNSATEAAISKYQSMLRVYPADGVWGDKTWNKMPEKDRKLLKDLIAQEGGLLDRFFNWIGVS